LFAITDNDLQPGLSRAQLLASEQTGKQVWETSAPGGSLRLLPYIAIDEEQYSTYLDVK
jgi:hypothetical protein